MLCFLCLIFFFSYPDKRREKNRIFDAFWLILKTVLVIRKRSLGEQKLYIHRIGVASAITSAFMQLHLKPRAYIL